VRDLAIIGAGPAGEAAAYKAAKLGASVTVTERDLVGGECPFWACMPSKTLLDAARRRACGADYPWERASARRDWMISREGTEYPSDAGHVRAFEAEGIEFVRGTGRLVAPGRVEVAVDGGKPVSIEARSVILSAGSVPFIPPIEGLDGAGYWTSRDATSTRELPSSLVVMGGGPIGVEMAQVFARFGSKVTVVEGNDRLLPRDHPQSSKAVADQIAEEGIDIRTGVTATAVDAGGPGRVVGLSDGTKVEAAQVLVAVGRRPADLRALGAQEAGATLDERGAATPDERLAIGDGVYVAGDAAGGLQFTHLADYEGRMTATSAIGGGGGVVDLTAVPRVTFTDPEVGAVGSTIEEARERGIDAFELTQDYAKTSRGQTIEGSHGHVSIVVDRGRRTLAGAFAACPGAGEFIHEAVLAMRARIPVDVLADTIGGFPTSARVLNNLFVEAADQLR
jgi:pyruvate/2-oxoglutarate dehydrogenase complex dihydrolipoamide dehydrogenase (E3) component